MPFDVYDRSLELIRQLAALVATMAKRDRDLADHIRRAANSVVLNIAEGRRRDGKDQRYHWRVAAGSAEEVRACVDAAVAWGDLDGASAAVALATLDRVAAMLHRLTR